MNTWTTWNRPRPGDWQFTYWRAGRVDLARGQRGWWLTIWRCRPPSAQERFRVTAEEWRGPVRVVRAVELAR